MCNFEGLFFSFEDLITWWNNYYDMIELDSGYNKVNNGMPFVDYISID